MSLVWVVAQIIERVFFPRLADARNERHQRRRDPIASEVRIYLTTTPCLPPLHQIKEMLVSPDPLRRVDARRMLTYLEQRLRLEQELPV